jgi:hypothetical protein
MSIGGRRDRRSRTAGLARTRRVRASRGAGAPRASRAGGASPGIQAARARRATRQRARAIRRGWVPAPSAPTPTGGGRARVRTTGPSTPTRGAPAGKVSVRDPKTGKVSLATLAPLSSSRRKAPPSGRRTQKTYVHKTKGGGTTRSAFKNPVLAKEFRDYKKSGGEYGPRAWFRNVAKKGGAGKARKLRSAASTKRAMQATMAGVGAAVIGAPKRRSGRRPTASEIRRRKMVIGR